MVEGVFMYNSVEEAIHFMVKANKGQKRKNENIDKSFHSMSVGMMIKNTTQSDDVVVAAILHDIIKDTEYGYEDIEEKFGSFISENEGFWESVKNFFTNLVDTVKGWFN